MKTNLKELLKANGDMKEKFQKVADMLEGGKKLFHLKKWTGTNKHRTLIDTDYYNMKTLLDCLNISYTLGNDAVRGGVVGDYILITADKRNKYYKLLSEKRGE